MIQAVRIQLLWIMQGIALKFMLDPEDYSIESDK